MLLRRIPHKRFASVFRGFSQPFDANYYLQDRVKKGVLTELQSDFDSLTRVDTDIPAYVPFSVHEFKHNKIVKELRDLIPMSPFNKTDYDAISKNMVEFSKAIEGLNLQDDGLYVITDDGRLKLHTDEYDYDVLFECLHGRLHGIVDVNIDYYGDIGSINKYIIAEYNLGRLCRYEVALKIFGDCCTVYTHTSTERQDYPVLDHFRY